MIGLGVSRILSEELPGVKPAIQKHVPKGDVRHFEGELTRRYKVSRLARSIFFPVLRPAVSGIEHSGSKNNRMCLMKGQRLFSVACELFFSGGRGGGVMSDASCRTTTPLPVLDVKNVVNVWDRPLCGLWVSCC